MEDNVTHDERYSCDICAGRMIFIRGRHPGTDNRLVCPTCLAERMDSIRDMTDPEYGKAYTATPPINKSKEQK